MGKNTPKPHDRLPSEDQGDHSAESIYAAVGRALTNWELLQEELTFLFALLAGQNSYPLMRAFGTLESAIPKVKMLRAAAEVSLSPQLLGDTKKLLSAIDDFNQRRNDIAHASVAEHANKERSLGFYLAPGFSVTTKFDIADWPNPSKYRWKAKQIDYYAEQFEQLRLGTKALFNRISESRRVPAKRPTSPKKSS